MPTYEYRCRDCDHEFETVQSFTDDALTTCPSCGGSLRKKFGNVGIAFKGSGFYKTDSRSSSSKASATSSTDTSTSDSSGSGAAGSDSSSSTSSGGDSSAKPAAPTTPSSGPKEKASA